MTNEQQTHTLLQQIEAFQNQHDGPARIKAVFAQGIQDLIQSGIANQSITQGKAPDFALPNVNGETIQLSQLLTKGPVVLIFYRGGWCPFCNLALRSYQAILPQIQSAGDPGRCLPSDPRPLALCKRENGTAFPCSE